MPASDMCCSWQHEQYQRVVASLCCRSSSKDITELHDFVLSVADRINKKYSRGSYLPVVWVERPVSLCEKIALYSIADVAVVTATRDGMNLVPYEYIICRQGAPVSPLPWLMLSCSYASYTESHPAGHALTVQTCCFAWAAHITDTTGLMILKSTTLSGVIACLLRERASCFSSYAISWNAFMSPVKPINANC